MNREEIDQKYIDQAAQLEAEFFDIIDEGLPSQHRVLKAGKSINEFNQRHGEIWHNHEAELIAEGLIEELVPPEPGRDLISEIDSQKAEIDDLKTRMSKLEN